MIPCYLLIEIGLFINYFGTDSINFKLMAIYRLIFGKRLEIKDDLIHMIVILFRLVH
jgi:hypothetical protein